MEEIKAIIGEICARKVATRVIPVIATELELKNELTRRGIAWTADDIAMMHKVLAESADVICRRTLHGKAYELNNKTNTDDGE